MNLAVVGGGGMRTPLLIAGLIERRAHLGIERVTLYDPDAAALEVVAILADAMLAHSGRPFTVTTTSNPGTAFAG
ncbi:MAG TPA: 6-phospho-beta-glucosidase, partial [bacterium]|nr:6-phospho-beta-glucosidase [bacterium]